MTRRVPFSTASFDPSLVIGLILSLINSSCSSNREHTHLSTDDSSGDSLSNDIDVNDNTAPADTHLSFEDGGLSGDAGMVMDGGPERDTETADSDADDTEDPTPDAIEMAVVRTGNWPGGGVEYTVRITHDGRPMTDAGWVAALDVTWMESPDAVFRISNAPLSPEFTALLIAPPDSDDARERLVSELTTFVQSRSPDERIAFYLWRKEVALLGNFSKEPNRLARLARRFSTLDGVPERMPLDAALRAVKDDTAGIGGVAPRGMRSVFVIGPQLADPTMRNDDAVPVFFASLDHAGALAEAVEQRDQLAKDAHYALAACITPEGDIGTLRHPDGAALDLQAEPTLEDEISLPCDVDLIGPGQRILTEQMSFEFDDAQRAVYQQVLSDKNKDDFQLFIRLSPERTPVAATAHLHGQSTLYCDRRSYTIDLPGARRLFHESSSDEYYLISMCKDEYYIQQYTANLVMKSLNLFPLENRFIELVIDGETQGVYLLMEKRKEELVRDNARVRGVLRRRMDTASEVSMETSYPAEEDPETIAAYEAFEATLQGLDGEALEAAVEEQLDLERYLRWIALMSAFQNGDFVDELIFVSTEQWGDDGMIKDWYEPMGWDNDDLFSECHFNGKNAIEDPYGLLYCVESPFDHLIFRDPHIYGRYVDVLTEVLTERASPSIFLEAVGRTTSDIIPLLQRAEIVAAMTELIESDPEAVDPDVAMATVDLALNDLSNRYSTRNQQMLDRIAAYHADVD